MTCFRSGRPATGCNAFGRADFIRFPWPAARITMESGTARVGSFFAMKVCSVIQDGCNITWRVDYPALESHQLVVHLGTDRHLGIRTSLVLAGFALLDQRSRFPEGLFQGPGRGNRVLQEGLAEVGQI